MTNPVYDAQVQSVEANMQYPSWIERGSDETTYGIRPGYTQCRNR